MTALGSMQPDKTHDAVSQRAAAFFEHRHFGDWSVADQAALDAWLAESLLHRAAYLRVEGIAAHTEHLVSLSPSEFGRAANFFERYRWFAVPLLAAASIALFVAFGMPLVLSMMQPPDRIYSTDIGGRTLIKFTDGTEIELNTDSSIRTRMTTTERTVWLEKGEAWFRVAHNAANPFAVVVGTHRVTDLGTEFFIRDAAKGMEVALLSGRAMLNSEGAATTMLAPGDDAVATRVSVQVTRKTPQELADALAWRRGVLVFRRSKLTDVVKEFNRYNATKLVIADPSIANVEITADLRSDDFEDFLNLAQTVLNLRADREGNEILISRELGEKTKRAARAKHSL